MAPKTIASPSAVHNAFNVRRLRRAASLTRMQLAEVASVPPEHIASFEKGYPIPLDSKRRILRALWAIIDGHHRQQ